MKDRGAGEELAQLARQLQRVCAGAARTVTDARYLSARAGDLRGELEELARSIELFAGVSIARDGGRHYELARQLQELQALALSSSSRLYTVLDRARELAALARFHNEREARR